MSNETTLCTCIEAGPLESQVMLLAESLRRFGGRRAELPMVAVRPRAGPRLATATKRKLAELNVDLIENNSNKFPWWATANKPAALQSVEDKAKSDNVTWIDGDMIVLKEPQTFAPPEGADFIARAGEAYDVASNGRDDRSKFWQLLCSRLQIDFDDFPDIVSFPDEKPIKAYWQAGLMTYRRECRFGQSYGDVFAMILNSDVASRFAGTYHVDQVAVALAVQKYGLKHGQYDPVMNFNVNPSDREASIIIPINDVLIVQYHGSLWPEGYEWAQPLFSTLDKTVFALIETYAPFNAGDTKLKFMRKIFSLARAAPLSAYEKRVVRY